MNAVEQQILDTVGGSNVDTEQEVFCVKGEPKLAHFKHAAAIAPAAVAESTDKLEPCPFCGAPARWATTTGGDDSWEIQCSSNDCCLVLFSGASGRETARSWNHRATAQHIANLESELQIARDLIQKMRQQLSAANLGSSMQHERYGSY